MSNTTQTQHSALPVAQVGEDAIFNLRKMPNGERVPVGTQLYMASDYANLQAINAQLLQALLAISETPMAQDCREIARAAIAAAESK